jgi:putative component of toxin-antitoxin plasmid stabilization module
MLVEKRRRTCQEWKNRIKDEAARQEIHQRKERTSFMN